MSTKTSKSLAKLLRRIKKVKSHLCVGIDVELAKIPEHFQSVAKPQFAYARWLIEQTAPYTCAYKFNLAFYEARGVVGWQELAETLEWVRSFDNSIWLLGDAKRGDIGNTSVAYARSLFETLDFDAATINPYMGEDAIRPFLEYKDKVSIVLCKTSNPGSGEFQDLLVQATGKKNSQPLWAHVAERVAHHWNAAGNCMLVVGATYPKDLGQVRKIVGNEMFMLVPGVGAQGGDLKKTLKAGLPGRLLITASRQIIYSPDPAQAAKELAAQLY